MTALFGRDVEIYRGVNVEKQQKLVVAKGVTKKKSIWRWEKKTALDQPPPCDDASGRKY